MNTELFNKFSPVLKSAIGPVEQDQRLLLESDGDIKVYYAPLEYINPDAKIVLIGITPGPTQMENANNVARRELFANASYHEAMKRAKKEGAFSGNVMRNNLNNELSHWGVNEMLGINHSDELFSSSSHLVQTTSLLRYPVFIGGKPYEGSPNMIKTPLLRKYLFKYFVKELEEINDALLLPLGVKVQKVLSDLIDEKAISPDRIVNGLLHPSPQNTYRINYLIEENRGPVPHATTPAPYDAGRKRFRNQFNLV